MFLIVVAGVITLLIVACVFVVVLHHRKGAERDLNLTNRVGTVETTLDPEGSVLVEGELWRARSETNERVERGRRVRVRGARGHLLVVAPDA